MYKAFGLIVLLSSILSSTLVSEPLGQSVSSKTDQSPIPEESLKLSADLVLVDVLPVQKKTGRIIGNLKPAASELRRLSMRDELVAPESKLHLSFVMDMR
jgi:hypothetical protein